MDSGKLAEPTITFGFAVDALGLLPPPVEHALTTSASTDAPRASMRNLRIGSSFRCCGVCRSSARRLMAECSSQTVTPRCQVYGAGYALLPGCLRRQRPSRETRRIARGGP